MGVVLCSTFAQVSAAAITAATIDDYYVATGEALGYFRLDYPEVWLVAGIPELGYTLEDHIVFDPTGGALEFASLIMSHEFVHWHSEGTAMQRNLPHTVMEGVSEWIAADLTEAWQEDRVQLYDGLLRDARERGELPRVIAQLDWSIEDWLKLSGEEIYVMYALGFSLVDRIGIDVLRELAELGPVSPETLLDLAGVCPDGGGLPLGTPHFRLDEKASYPLDKGFPFETQFFIDAEGARFKVPLPAGLELDTRDATWWSVEDSGRMHLWTDERTEVFPRVVERTQPSTPTCLKICFSDKTGASLGCEMIQLPGAAQVPEGAVSSHSSIVPCPTSPLCQHA